MGAIFSYRQLIEKYLVKRTNLHMVYINLEKACDKSSVAAMVAAIISIFRHSQLWRTVVDIIFL